MRKILDGLLIYNTKDYFKNSAYSDWLISTAQEFNINLELAFHEDIQNQFVDKNIIDFVINRTRSHNLALLFELGKIRVFNNSTVALLGNNKLAAYKFALDKGYNFPHLKIKSDELKTLSKPNDGHGGEKITLVDSQKMFHHLNSLESGRVYIYQQYIENAIGDIRFYIIGNKIVHAVLRHSNGRLVANFSQGGTVEVFPYTKTHEQYVHGLISGLQIDYAGVDFLLTSEGELVFNEIEDVAGSRMLSALGINDTPHLFLEHIAKSLS